MSYEYDMDDPLVYRNEMGRYKTERQLLFLRKFLPRNGMKVLDIGGGGGRLAIPLANLGHRVTVIDPSMEALDLLTRRAGHEIEVIHSDIMGLLCSERFDVAMTIDMLKYVTAVSLSDIFSKVNSILLMGGTLLISEINKNSWRSHLSELLGRRRQRYNIESPAGYKNALRQAGFEIESITGFSWMPFRFNSNSPLIGLFRGMEETLHLGDWIGQSPWLLIAAKKTDENQTMPGER